MSATRMSKLLMDDALARVGDKLKEQVIATRNATG
jgi:hypothetical protein